MPCLRLAHVGQQRAKEPQARAVPFVLVLGPFAIGILSGFASRGCNNLTVTLKFEMTMQQLGGETRRGPQRTQQKFNMNDRLEPSHRVEGFHALRSTAVC